MYKYILDWKIWLITNLNFLTIKKSSEILEELIHDSSQLMEDDIYSNVIEFEESDDHFLWI